MDKPLPLDTIPPELYIGMSPFFDLCPDVVRIGKIRDEIRERIINTSVVTDRETEVRWILRKFRAAVPFLSMEELLLVSLEAQLPSPGLIGYPYYQNETGRNLVETYVKVASSGKIEHMGIGADRYLNMCIGSWESLIQVLREVCEDFGMNLYEVWGKERRRWYPQLFDRLSSGELNEVEMREKQKEILDSAHREGYSNITVVSERMEAFNRYEERLKIFDDIMIFLDNHKVRPFFRCGWLYECFALPVPTRPDERPKTTAVSEEREEQATQVKSEQPTAVGRVGESEPAVSVEEEKERDVCAILGLLDVAENDKRNYKKDIRHLLETPTVTIDRLPLGKNEKGKRHTTDEIVEVLAPIMDKRSPRYPAFAHLKHANSKAKWFARVFVGKEKSEKSFQNALTRYKA
jgi:hypothetical protein